VYGLLGKTLSHSFSKRIHEKIDDEPYHLYETDDVGSFLTSNSFKGVNVTHPYKQAVMNHLDTLDSTAKKTDAVNTIVKKNHKLIGYNTDYLALRDIIQRRFPKDKNTTIGILGNGATMRSLKHALNDENYRNITIYARNPRKDECPLNQISADVEVLINATPVGMYPNNNERFPFRLQDLRALTFVFDVVYNPFKTRLLMEAEALGAETMNGLELLIRQALLSRALYKDKNDVETKPTSLLRSLYEELSNIVLIGLPYAGKSHYGERLAKTLNKPFVDIDQYIESHHGCTIERLFDTEGEAAFRHLEYKAIQDFGKKHGQIIAPGGGVVLSAEVMMALMQNGVLVFLDLDESLLAEHKMTGRPLANTMQDFKKLKNERQSLYEHYCDIVVDKNTWDENVILGRIKEGLNAYFNR